MAYRYIDTTQHSQADDRTFRVFRDQHGRKWGADCEKATMHPCGPLTPRGWKSPLRVPNKYMRITDSAAGELYIEYDRWLEDLRGAHTEYDMFALAEATKLFGDKGPQAILDRDPALLRRVGPSPEPMERVMAAKAGNRWVLGLDDQKPKWAAKYLPAPVAAKLTAFPNAEEEFPDVDEPVEVQAPGEYPRMYAPGRWYLDPDHEKLCKTNQDEPFQGKKVEAEHAAALRAGEEPVTSTHDSWS